MSIKQRHALTAMGEPQLTLTVTGIGDVYRVAEHLTHGQCDLADKGRRSIRYLKRKAGRERWAALLRRWHR